MSKRLLLLNLVLVTAAVVFSVHLVRILSSSPQLPLAPGLRAPQATPSPAEERPRPTTPLAAYDAIASKNLFNPSRSETSTATVGPTVKPFLYGIVITDGIPAAFLEDPLTKKVYGYKLGDQVAGGRLERVEADRVVIRHGEGTTEVLLRDPAKPKPVAAAAPPAPTAQPGSSRVQPPPVPPPTLFRRPQAPAAPR